MKWYQLTYYLLMGFGFLAGMYRFRFLSLEGRLITILLAMSLLTELISAWLIGHKQSNLLIYALYQPIFYGLLTWLYYREIKLKVMLISIAIYVILCSFNSIYWQPITTKFSTNTMLILFIMTSVWVLLFFRKMLIKPTNYLIFEFTLFWISCGLLFFNVVNIFMLGAYNFLATHYLSISQNPSTIIRYFTVHVLYFTMIMSILSRQHRLPSA